MKTKKAFALFLTLILVYLFSILAIQIYESKSINSINTVKQYKYIQAKNHMKFLKEYILSLDELQGIDKIQISNKDFEIIAFLKKIENNNFQAELTVKAYENHIRLYKSVEIIK